MGFSSNNRSIYYLMGDSFIIFLICRTQASDFVPWNFARKWSLKKGLINNFKQKLFCFKLSRFLHLIAKTNCSLGISRFKKNFNPLNRLLSFLRFSSSTLAFSNISGCSSSAFLFYFKIKLKLFKIILIYYNK